MEVFDQTLTDGWGQQGTSCSSSHSLEYKGESANQEGGHLNKREEATENHDRKSRKERNPSANPPNPRYPKVVRSPVHVVSLDRLMASKENSCKSRPVSPQRGQNILTNEKERESEKYRSQSSNSNGDNQKHWDNSQHQKYKDIDARVEPVPNSHFSRSGM